MAGMAIARTPAWKQHTDHLLAQRLGQERWYRAYTVRIGRIERDYGWPR